MTRPVSNLNYSNTFGHVLSTVNLLADTVTRFAVTTNGTGWGDSAVAFGNAYVNGSIHVTQLFASNVSTSSLAASGNVSVLGSLSITGPLLSFSNGSTQFTANSTAIVVDTTAISSAGKFTSNSTLFDLLTSGRVNGTLAVTGNTSLGSNTLFVNGTSVSVNGSQNVAGAFSAQSIVSNTTLAAGNTTVGSLAASGALTVSNTAVLGNTTVGSLTASGAVNVTNTASFGNTTVTRLTASAAAQLNSTLTVVGSTVLAATTVNGALSVANAASFGNTTINGFANVNAGSATSALSVRTSASNTYLSLFNSNNVANRFGLESNTIVVGTAANTALRLTPAPTTNNETFNYAGSPESNTIVARINGRSVIDGDLIVTGSVRALTLTSNTGDLANLFIRNDIDGNAAGVVTFLAGTRHRAPVRLDTATDGVPQSPVRWQSQDNTRAIELAGNPTNADNGSLRVTIGGSNTTVFTGANTTFSVPVYAATFHGNVVGSAASLTNARLISLGGVLSGSASFDGSANVTITASFNGPVSVVAGGTSFSSYAAGDILYASGTTSLAKLAIAPANNVLITTGSNFPSWGKLPLASHVSGTLPIGNLPVATSGTSSSTQLVRADDSRLSDARTPATHALDGAQHSISGKTAGQMLLATGATSFGFVTMSGDATISGGGSLTIASNAVSNTKLADMAGNTIKGRLTSTGDPQDLSVTETRKLLLVENDVVGSGTVRVDAGSNFVALRVANTSTNSTISSLSVSTPGLYSARPSWIWDSGAGSDFVAVGRDVKKYEMSYPSGNPNPSGTQYIGFRPFGSLGLSRLLCMTGPADTSIGAAPYIGVLGIAEESLTEVGQSITVLHLGNSSSAAGGSISAISLLSVGNNQTESNPDAVFLDPTTGNFYTRITIHPAAQIEIFYVTTITDLGAANGNFFKAYVPGGKSSNTSWQPESSYQYYPTNGVIE